MQELPENIGVKCVAHIQLLGRFSVYASGKAIPDGKGKSRRARSLVKLLALAPGHRLHRDQVIDALWPDADLSAAANNFHQTLYAARKILEPAGGFSLALEEGFLSLYAEQGQMLSVDVELFETAAAQAKDSQDLVVFQAALALYPGDLLPDELYVEWTIQRRATLRQAYLNLLLGLARLQETRQEYPNAIDTLLRLLASDHSHEEANIQLMRLYALSGQRQQALRQYQALRDALQVELDAEPGEHAVQVYEDIQAGRLSLLPPTTTLHPHNLPVQLTSFIGREKQINEVSQLVHDHRLVTLTGSGGTGKTRLALQAAGEILEAFPDGAWLVELAPLADPQSVAQAIATALGLQRSGESSYQAILLNYLQKKQLLLIMDNCEHLLEACAQLAHELLRYCPAVTLLATSREALGIAGETAYRVPSLTAPDPASLLPEELAQSEALRLFADRAAAIRPDFQLTTESLPAAAQICRRLDGIPLSIELAAARVGVLSVEQITARLDDRFRLLTGGSRTALPRQRTLRASIDWSYSLLPEDERLLLQRLSVFSGGWTLAAAEQVCALEDTEPWKILEGLASLVNKSLVTADHHPGGETRYRMLETIRQYAQERLEDTGGAAQVRDAHLGYFLALAEEYETLLRTPRIGEVLTRLDLEVDNLRAALNWALGMGNREGAEKAARMACALSYFWEARGLRLEAIAWMEHTLPLLNAEDPASAELRAKTCFTISLQYGFARVEMDKARRYTEESARLYRRLGNPHGLALALALNYAILYFNDYLWIPPYAPFSKKNAPAIKAESLSIASALLKSPLPIDRRAAAYVYYYVSMGDGGQGRFEELLNRAQQAHAIFAELGDRQGEIYSITTILLRLSLDRLDKAEMRNSHWEPDPVLIEHVLSLVHSLNLRIPQSRLSGSLGVLAYSRGHYEEMVTYSEDQCRLAPLTGDIFLLIWATRMSGVGLLHLGDIPAARRRLQQGLELARQHADPNGVLAFLIHLAGTAAAQDPQGATQLLGFVERQYEDFFIQMSSWDRLEFDRYTAQIRAALDEAEFNTLWGEGRELAMEQALDSARKI